MSADLCSFLTGLSDRRFRPLLIPQGEAAPGFEFEVLKLLTWRHIVGLNHFRIHEITSCGLPHFLITLSKIGGMWTEISTNVSLAADKTAGAMQ